MSASEGAERTAGLDERSSRIFAWSIAFEALLVAVTRWLTRPRVADDYDSMNFLLGMTHYDLSHFQPQFPGYPVYVGAGAMLHRLGVEPLTAAVAISTLAMAFATVALASIAWRLAGPKSAVAVGALQVVAWLPWLVGNSALSESLGVCLALASFASLVAHRPRPLLSGIAAGLTLGVRLSYWPLILALVILAAIWKRRSAVLAGLGLGLALWLVPFVAIVGPAKLIRLGRVHVAGHFEQWGGSVVTRPNLAQRTGAFARDIFYDGLAPSPWAAGAIALIVLAVAFRNRRRLRALPWKPVVLVLAPYALWAFLAQNILEQPRHTLPLVEGFLLLLAMLLAETSIARAAVYALTMLVSVPLAVQRHRVGPPAEQAAQWLAATQPFGDTLVAGTRSARFFRDVAQRQTRPGPTGDEQPYQVREDPWISGLIGELARVDRLPGSLWSTSEVDLHSGNGEGAPLPSKWQFDPGPTFCRDERINRFQPCLTLTRVSWGAR